MLSVLSVTFAAAVASVSSTVGDVPPPLPLSERIRDPRLIRTAVGKALAADARPSADGPAGGDAALRGTAYEGFARSMEDARVPDCLHQDGLKRQPTFFLSGYLALPFIAIAKLRGKCN